MALISDHGRWVLHATIYQRPGEQFGGYWCSEPALATSWDPESTIEEDGGAYLRLQAVVLTDAECEMPVCRFSHKELHAKIMEFWGGLLLFQMDFHLVMSTLGWLQLYSEMTLRFYLHTVLRVLCRPSC